MADDLLIDGPGIYKIFSGSQEITLNIRGRTFSHRSSLLWDAVKAVQSETGFEVLLEGEGKHVLEEKTVLRIPPCQDAPLLNPSCEQDLAGVRFTLMSTNARVRDALQPC